MATSSPGIPAGGDVYLLVNALHDWADQPAARILSAVADQVPDQGKLLIVEGLPGVEGAAASAGGLDLHMLVVWGGRVRRLDQWHRMLAVAGLTLREMRPAGPRWILECGRSATSAR